MKLKYNNEKEDANFSKEFKETNKERYHFPN